MRNAVFSDIDVRLSAKRQSVLPKPFDVKIQDIDSDSQCAKEIQ